MSKTTKAYSERPAVTTWSDWADIFESWSIRDERPPGKLSRDANAAREIAHTWMVDDWNQRSDAKRKRKLPCYLSSYCRVKIFTGTLDDRSWRDVVLTVVPTAQAIETISKHAILPEYDTLSIEVIEWPDDRALVVCHNSKIIGGPWLAKIKASTIPAALRARWTIESGRGLCFDGRHIATLDRALDDNSTAEIAPSDLDDLGHEIAAALNASGRTVKARVRK